MHRAPLLLVVVLLFRTSPAAAQPLDCAPAGEPDAILRCEERRLATADESLGKHYRATVRALHDDPAPDAQAALRTLTNAQRQWIRFRDDDCDAVYLTHHRADLRERYRLRCKTAHADMRARQLSVFSE